MTHVFFSSLKALWGRCFGTGRVCLGESKTHAAMRIPDRCPAEPPLHRPQAARCHTATQVCPRLTQGKPVVWGALARGARCWVLTTGLLVSGMAAAAPCAGPVMRFVPLAPGHWLVPADEGDATAANRGQVSNLVLVQEDGPTPRLWALGSGPSRPFGQSLACQVRLQLGLDITDVVSPWARPELVLGVAGLEPAVQARHWAHASVAEAMAEQCPHCIERLRHRLGDAAGDLAGQPIALPAQRLAGEQGRLGPFDWWRLPRADGRWVTLWRSRQALLWVAHGVLQGSSPPDGRDADLRTLQQSTARVLALSWADGAQARYIGEQGPPVGRAEVQQQLAYWQALHSQVAAAIERGDDETAPPPRLPGAAGPPRWATHPWHALNWQRAWRQEENRLLNPAPR